MSGLNPNSVVVRTGSYDYRNDQYMFLHEKSSRVFNTNDERYDALYDPADPINSKLVVESICLISENANDEITSGCIMLEIQRLLTRSIRVDNKIDDINLNSILFGTVMQSIKTCIESIVSDKADPSNYYRSVILYNIASLMDIYNINTETKEAAKLPAFINYFIDALTKNSK